MSTLQTLEEFLESLESGEGKPLSLEDYILNGALETFILPNGVRSPNMPLSLVQILDECEPKQRGIFGLHPLNGWFVVIPKEMELQSSTGDSVREDNTLKHRILYFLEVQ